MGVQLTVTGIQSARAVKSRSLTHLAEGLLVGVGGNLFGDGDADVSAVGLAREDVDAGLPCGGKERKREVSKHESRTGGKEGRNRGRRQWPSKVVFGPSLCPITE